MHRFHIFVDLSSVMRELYRDLKLHIAETRELRKTMQSCSLCGRKGSHLCCYAKANIEQFAINIVLYGFCASSADKKVVYTASAAFNFLSYTRYRQWRQVHFQNYMQGQAMP